MKFELMDKIRVKKCENSFDGRLRRTEDFVAVYFKDSVRLRDRACVIPRENVQLILESPKLKLRLSQNGLKLKVKILEQDDSLRGKLYISTVLNGKNYDLASSIYPAFCGVTMLRIKGIRRAKDNYKISYDYPTQEDLDNFVEALRIMMKSEKLK